MVKSSSTSTPGNLSTGAPVSLVSQPSTRENGPPTISPSTSIPTPSTSRLSETTPQTSGLLATHSLSDYPYPKQVNKKPPPNRNDAADHQAKHMTWVSSGYNPGCHEPSWTSEPDIQIITNLARQHVPIVISPLDQITVKFLDQGLFNIVYIVVVDLDSSDSTHKEYIFRVAMPIDPYYKTESEVCTMHYVATHTTIPVPRVYAFDSSIDDSNPLGLEWILMEKMIGTPYEDMNNSNSSLSREQDEQILLTVADWTRQLWSCRFTEIGSLFWRAKPEEYFVHQAEILLLMTDGQSRYQLYRGPFDSLKDFFSAIIQSSTLLYKDPRMMEKALENQNTNAALGEIKHYWWLPRHLKDSLPNICNGLASVLPYLLTNKPIHTHLCHTDIHSRNVLVDNTGRPTALLDWEFTMTLPDVLIPKHPKILQETYEWWDYRRWDLNCKDGISNVVYYAEREKFEQEFEARMYAPTGQSDPNRKCDLQSSEPPHQDVKELISYINQLGYDEEGVMQFVKYILQNYKLAYEE